MRNRKKEGVLTLWATQVLLTAKTLLDNGIACGIELQIYIACEPNKNEDSCMFTTDLGSPTSRAWETAPLLACVIA
jgi:hypothetical protein